MEALTPWAPGLAFADALGLGGMEELSFQPRWRCYGSGSGTRASGAVDRDPRQVADPQRAAGMGHPQALGQQQFQLVAEALPPVAQVRALMREAVLEELLTGEVLEVRIIDPALAHAFVGQPINVLEQQEPDRKARLDPRSPLVAVERRDLAIDPVPVHRTCELCQFVPEVDDLDEPCPEQIIRSPCPVLLRPSAC